MVTQELLKNLFEYHFDGYFIRKCNGKIIKPIIHANKRYARVSINGKPYPLHRMIFLFFHGYLPKVTDHIDGNRTNNRIENLREVTHQQNSMNKKRDFNSSSPYKGVLPRKSKYTGELIGFEVYVSVNKKSKFFGYFKDIELADLVATEARNLYHGAFARHQ